MSPDGRTLASGGNDAGVRIWNAATGALVKTLPQTDTVNSVAFSPDGRSLAVGVGDPVEASARSSITIFDVATWAPRVTVTASCGILFNVTYRPDGANVAASCADGSAHIWPAR